MRVPRNLVLLGLLPALAASSPLAAQRKEFTIFAGGNLSGANGPNVAKTESRTGFQAGFNFRLPHSPRLSFQAGLMVVERRFSSERTPSELPPLLVGPRADAPNLLFAQVPLTLRFQKGYSTERPVRPYMMFGVYVGVRLACRRQLTEADGVVHKTDCSVTSNDLPPSNGPFLPARYQDLDAGFLGELGVEIKRFSLGLRGVRGMGNIVDGGPIPTSPLDGAKLWTLALSVDYLLRIL